MHKELLILSIVFLVEAAMKRAGVSSLVFVHRPPDLHHFEQKWISLFLGFKLRFLVMKCLIIIGTIIICFKIMLMRWCKLLRKFCCEMCVRSV